MPSDSLFKEYENIFKTEEVIRAKDKKEKIFAYSPFALQDALGEKNIKKVWLEYQKLIFEKVEPEELVYKIISKIRDMALISRGATAEDLGIKSFPYNKSKKDLKNWKTNELEDFYEKIVSIYHGSRMGKGPLALELEKLILSL